MRIGNIDCTNANGEGYRVNLLASSGAFTSAFELRKEKETFFSRHALRTKGNGKGQPLFHVEAFNETLAFLSGKKARAIEDTLQAKALDAEWTPLEETAK